MTVACQLWGVGQCEGVCFRAVYASGSARVRSRKRDARPPYAIESACSTSDEVDGDTSSSETGDEAGTSTSGADSAASGDLPPSTTTPDDDETSGTDTTGEPLPPVACSADPDCPAGALCVDNLCTPGCRSSDRSAARRRVWGS